MNFLYPGGLRKALTFSYDDGQIFDLATRITPSS